MTGNSPLPCTEPIKCANYCIKSWKKVSWEKSKQVGRKKRLIISAFIERKEREESGFRRAQLSTAKLHRIHRIRWFR